MLFLVVLGVVHLSVSANDTKELQFEMIPANILNSSNPEKSLINNIKFPKGNDDVKIFMRCETYIAKKGLFIKPFCYNSGEGHEEYTNNMFNGMKNSKAIPAIINGEKAKIWTPFSILFKRTNGHEKITILPNHLNHVKEYGYYYTAPQRYKKRDLSKCTNSLNKTVLFIQTISNTGTVENVENNKGRCTDSIAKTFYDAKYIPAQANNQFVKSTVTEYIFPFARIDKH